MAISRGMVVRFKDPFGVSKLGVTKLGVTVDDNFNCCSPEETPVVWEGETSFEGAPTDQLEVVGPENPEADFKKCGAGEGPKCCIFLVGGPKGAECARHSSVRITIIMRSHKMNAKRHPTKMYPACQDLSDG